MKAAKRNIFPAEIKKNMKLRSLSVAALLLALVHPLDLVSMAESSTQAQAPPRIFFSDLESGPNTGGQNNRGVWVTIWGKGFGVDRDGSTVTVGGGAAAEYPIWTDTKITFQLGPSAKTGDRGGTVRAKAAKVES